MPGCHWYVKFRKWLLYFLLWISDGLRDLTSYAKDILKGLRELEGFSPMASEIMKVLVEEPESKAVS